MKTENQMRCGKLLRTILLLLLIILVSHLLVAAAIASETNFKGVANPGQKLKTIIGNDYYPYTFLNDKGVPDGFSVEIARAVATAMALELEIRADKWDQAMKELETGRIDLIPMMAYTPERDKIFDFSVPYAIGYDAIFIKKGKTGLRSLKDLSGKTVIVMNNDAAHSYLLRSGLSKKMSLKLVDSLPEALKQLAAGKGDAAIMPKLVGMITVKDLKLYDIEPSPLLIYEYNRPFSFAVKQGNQALIERLNQGLNIIKSTGQYDTINKKWFGALEDPHFHREIFIKYGAAVVLVLFGFIVWNMLLKRQVKSKTAHLEAEISQRIKNEERFRTVADYTYDWEYWISPEGRILYMSPSCKRITGYTVEEFLNDPAILLNSAHPDEREKLTCHLESVFKETPPHSSDLRIITKKGETRWINHSCQAVYDTKGLYSGRRASNRDITERKQAEEALANARNVLESQVQDRTNSLTTANLQLNLEIKERKRIEQEILDHQQKLQVMTRELAMAEERERDRIAGELHDHVGQRLILGKMRLDSLASRLPSDQFENDVDEISTLIDHSIQDIRSLTFQLRPPILASAGLEAAVQWLGEEFKKDFGLQIDFKDDNEPKPMQYEVRSTVFQVVRELLLNVAKHAGTKHVAVRMKRDNGNIVINIDDEGIGFDISEVSKRKVKDGGFGLFSINQRIDFLGGSLSIDTNSGNGTRATIIVPLKE